MRAADILALTSVSDPQLSPDGRHIAYVLTRVDEPNNAYSSQIWIAATDGATPPRALSAGAHQDGAPRWSPDGSRIAFTSTRKKDAKGRSKSTLHLLPFDQPGETVLLAEHDEPFTSMAWSPDGTLLAVTARVRGDHYTHDEISRRPPRKIESLFTTLNGQGFVVDRPQHVHLVATDGAYPMRDITPGPWECASPAWFPDSARLAMTVNRFPNDFTNDIGVVSIDADPDATEADIELLTDASGGYGAPVVMPDGSGVLVRGIDDMTTVPQNEHIGVLTVGEVGTPDWKSHAVDRTWTPTQCGSNPAFIDDTTVVTSFEDRGDTHLAKLNLSTGAVDVIADGELTITHWSAVDDVVAYAASTATSPSELFVLRNGTTTQLTNHGHAFVSRVEPQPPEHFLAPSGDIEVDAWIVTPHGFDPAKKYPMLLNIHGGPFTQYGNFFFDEVQMQARQGFVVVYSNPRGGSGREQAWGQAILGPKHPTAPGSGWGGLDYDDLMAVVDTALAKYDFIDANRMGVLGGSYGGYMTSWIVTHTNRFAAACSERAANNLLSLEHSSDIGGFFHAEIGPKFYDDPDEYVRMSPTSYVKDIETPLLIIHSEDDLRCPADQAWQLFNAMTMLGKEVEFQLFPGENHELSRSGSPVHRVQRADIIHEYFTRHLMP